jgi:SanA protein
LIRFLAAVCVVALGGLVVRFVLGGMAQTVLVSYGMAYSSRDVRRLPALDVALVLGTQPYTRRGRFNTDLGRRLDAAALAWREGKVRRVIASGNRVGEAYDEPTAMMKALIARGVPAEAIERDFGGTRTWLSVRRARDIYGLKRVLIVSQRSHLDRALFLARRAGLEAWGFDAIERPRSRRLYYGLYTVLRALRAFSDAVLDRHSAPASTGR